MSKELLILSAGVAEPYLLNLSNYLNQEFHERKMNYTCVPWTEQIIYSPGADTISSLLSYGKRLKDSAGYLRPIALSKKLKIIINDHSFFIG